MSCSYKKSIKRKSDILKASQELFNIKGFQATSINDIMNKVGAAKSVFYYYYETKEQILDDLVNINIGQIAKAMSDIVDNKQYSALEKIQKMLIEEFKISFTEYNKDNHVHNIKDVDMHQKLLVRMTYVIAPLFSKAIDQGIKEGIFHVKYPLETTEIILAGIHFITDLGVFNWNKEQYWRKVNASAELIEKVLGIAPGSFKFLNTLLKDIPNIVDGKHTIKE
jgi:AcrR family transcriptional regulator